jgi:hypothetical protein
MTMPPKSIAAAVVLAGALTVGGGVAFATGVTNPHPADHLSGSPIDDTESTEAPETTEATEAPETTESTDSVEAPDTDAPDTELPDVTEPPDTTEAPASDQGAHGAAVSAVAQDHTTTGRDHGKAVSAAARDRSTLPAGARH